MLFVATRYLPDPHDPCRNPAWRWLCCGCLLDHGHSPLRQDDALTNQSWHFWHTLTQCRTDADRDQLALEFPGLVEAHGVYTGEPLKSWEQHRSRGRGSRPLWNGSLATPSYSPDGEVIREEAASVAAPQALAVDVTAARKSACSAHPVATSDETPQAPLWNHQG